LRYILVIFHLSLLCHFYIKSKLCLIDRVFESVYIVYLSSLSIPNYKTFWLTLEHSSYCWPIKNSVIAEKIMISVVLAGNRISLKSTNNILNRGCKMYSLRNLTHLNALKPEMTSASSIVSTYMPLQIIKYMSLQIGIKTCKFYFFFNSCPMFHAER